MAWPTSGYIFLMFLVTCKETKRTTLVPDHLLSEECD